MPLGKQSYIVVVIFKVFLFKNILKNLFFFKKIFLISHQKDL